ncbi:hypothetical protein FQZ97_841300 [compost metagenome]
MQRHPVDHDGVGKGSTRAVLQRGRAPQHQIELPAQLGVADAAAVAAGHQAGLGAPALLGPVHPFLHGAHARLDAHAHGLHRDGALGVHVGDQLESAALRFGQGGDGFAIRVAVGRLTVDEEGAGRQFSIGEVLQDAPGLKTRIGQRNALRQRGARMLEGAFDDHDGDHRQGQHHRHHVPRARHALDRRLDHPGSRWLRVAQAMLLSVATAARPAAWPSRPTPGRSRQSGRRVHTTCRTPGRPPARRSACGCRRWRSW